MSLPETHQEPLTTINPTTHEAEPRIIFAWTVMIFWNSHRDGVSPAGYRVHLSP